jgi:hypothetical protein
MSAIDDILGGYQALQAGQEAFYEDLPANPLAEAPAPASAHPADRYRGADRGRPGLARLVT